MHEHRMAADEAEYWERRRSLAPSPSSGSDADGTRRIGLFADVDDAAFLAYYRDLLDRLRGFDCLAPTPPRKLHVTVKMFDRGTGYSRVLGGPRPGAGRLPDPVRRTIASVEPFELSFPRFNLFPDVVYAEVDDGGVLADLNRALCDLEATTEMARDGDNYIPHLTLGYLTGREGYDGLVDYLEANRELDLPSVRVEELALVAYDLADGPHPEYETVETYELDSLVV